MSKIDILVVPTCPCQAPRRGIVDTKIEHWSGSVRQALMTYTAPFNVAGFPAISLPIGDIEDALPCGLQLIARPGEDAALLRFAEEVESIIVSKPVSTDA